MKKTKSIYKYVSLGHQNGRKYWFAHIGRFNWQKYFKESQEHEAALAVDKFLISKGKEPVNILKRK